MCALRLGRVEAIVLLLTGTSVSLLVKLELTGNAGSRQISTIIAQYKAACIDQRILGRFFDNQDLTRFQTLLDDKRLPVTRLRCAHSTQRHNLPD